MDRIMAIGAHPDDLEIGAFGSLAKWSEQHEICLVVVTDGGYKNPDLTDIRIQEAKSAAQLIKASIHFLGFPDGQLEQASCLRQALESLVVDFKPHRVIVNSPNDMHPDHRVLSLSTLAATRNISDIWFYETPSTVEIKPNIFVDITAFMPLKLSAIKRHKTQSSKFYMQEETIYSTAKFRSRRFRKQGLYAEAFELFKCCI